MDLCNRPSKTPAAVHRYRQDMVPQLALQAPLGKLTRRGGMGQACSIVAHATIILGWELQRRAFSDERGKVIFSNLPSGYGIIN